MPLPVAHSLAGLAVFKGLDADGTLLAWRRLLAAVVIANIADLDLVPGIFAGEPNRYHHVGFSHSAVSAMVERDHAKVLAEHLVALEPIEVGSCRPSVQQGDDRGPRRATEVTHDDGAAFAEVDESAGWQFRGQDVLTPVGDLRSARHAAPSR